MVATSTRRYFFSYLKKENNEIISFLFKASEVTWTIYSGISGDSPSNKKKLFPAAKIYTAGTFVFSTPQNVQKDLEDKIAEVERKILDTEVKIEAAYSKEEKISLMNYLTTLVKYLQKLDSESRKLWKDDARSVFGPVGTEVPSVIQRKVENAQPFQDRRTELRLIWDTFIYNWLIRNQKQTKFKFAVTGQIFGSGKTTFGENILNFDVEHIAEEFAKVEDSPGKEALRSAIYLSIDLQQVEPPPRGVMDVSDMVSYSI